MKKRILSLLITLCMLTSLFGVFSITVHGANAPSDWALAEVNTAITAGLVTEKVTSDYQKAITREEFCELVVKLYEKLTNEQANFSNNPFSDTDNTEILKAYSLGIVKGISDTAFAPNNNITRQELCVMLVRAIEAILGDEFMLKYDFVSFHDVKDIADWALEQIYYSYEKGIVKGVGENKFNPLGTATCEQAIIMACRLYQNIESCKTTIPKEVIDRYENYTYINNTFLEIEKKYTNESGYVPPEKIEALLDEIYTEAQTLLRNGEITQAQLNRDFLNVCILLKDGSGYLYSPTVEGLANTPQKTTDIIEVDNFRWNDVVVHNKAGDVAAETFDFCDYSYIDTTKQSITALKAKLSSLRPDKKYILFWHGHGSVETLLTHPLSIHGYGPQQFYSGVTFGIPEEASLNTQYKFQNDIEEHRIIFFKDAYGLTPAFFDTYIPKIKSGLFFAGTCYSMCDNGLLANVFLNKGFDTYIGSNLAVLTQYANDMMNSFGDALCLPEDLKNSETIPAEEALKIAKTAQGATDGDVVEKVYEFIYQTDIASGGEFLLKGEPNFRLVDYNFKTVGIDGEHFGSSFYYVSGHTLYQEKDGKRTAVADGIYGTNVITNGKEVYYGTQDLNIKHKNLKDGTVKTVYTEIVPENIQSKWSSYDYDNEFSLNVVGINENRLFFYLSHTVGAIYLKGIDLSTAQTIFLRDDLKVENGEMVNHQLVVFPTRRDVSASLKLCVINMDTLTINNLGNLCFYQLKPYKNGFCYWDVAYSDSNSDATLMYHSFDTNHTSNIFHANNIDLGGFSYGKHTATYSSKNKNHTFDLTMLIN